ncbi:SusE domain-containing protein [Flavobacterium sp.]|uniref:SusE domain-containing protein n=1 Tax=Flavobacterium sp. TaxID=239 RepID=UPI0039E6C1A0
MKNILRTSIFAFMLVALGACENDTDPNITPGTSFNLQSPAPDSDFVLTPQNQDNLAMSLVWDQVNNGVPSVASYTVEMAAAGTDFENIIEAGVTNNRFLSLTVAELNGKLIAANFAPYTEADVDIRVKSTLGTSINAVVGYSNVVTVTITPYTTENPTIAVPGNHQGWSPPTAPLLASSGFGETDYEGYMWLDGEYKFLSPKPDGTFDWGTLDWGDDGTFTNTLVADGEVNCTTAAGYYYVKADTDALTYSATPTVWGIAGNATTNGWDGMLPMTYDPVAKTWSIVATLTTQAAPDNGLKFKANGAWDINFGDSGADGSLEYGGQNIGTTAGTYLIVLDLSNPREYTYTLTPQ